MTESALTRRQRSLVEYLQAREAAAEPPPSLDELCEAMGLASRGSLHKQVQALIAEGLVEPMNGKQRGVRLTSRAHEDATTLPLLGRIAAGRPIEAISGRERVEVPGLLRGRGECFVLEVRGDSMTGIGILDGDYVVIESRQDARSGEIVVALVDEREATLKRLEKKADEIVLHAENPAYPAQRYPRRAISIQGVLVGQMRRYQ